MEPDKSLCLIAALFEIKVKVQTEETAWFDLDKGPGYRKMWTPFVKSMIRSLIDSPRRMTFAKMTGRQWLSSAINLTYIITLPMYRS